MAWVDLAEDISNEFALREGCLEGGDWWGKHGLRVVGDYVPGGGRQADPVRRAAYVASRSKTESERLRKREYNTKLRLDPEKRFLKNAKAKILRLKKLIKKHQTQIQVILVGRGLDPARWLEVMMNPVSGEECDAFTDFAYHLRHHGASTNQIATLLGCNAKEVDFALSQRMVK